MTTLQTPAEAEEFVGKVLTDSSAWLATTLAMIGDRLGLWEKLCDEPVTSVELAERSGINERYAREWLAAMSAHGYLTYDPATARFELPVAHRPALAEQGGPMFFGGVHQEMLGLVTVIDQLIDAFRNGGGVPLSAYGPNFWQGLTRFTAGGFDHQLLQHWLPAMPDVEAALERGCAVADIGCGQGRALVRLARAFPASHYVGYDLYEPSLEAARAHAAESLVDDRVRFERLDASAGLPNSYDLITAFDVVHDAVNPRGLLQRIRQALKPNGRFVCLDINSSPHLTENAGPVGTFLYGFSVLFCMPVSLADHGEGLGTCGFNEPAARELSAEAGFTEVRIVPQDDPFHTLYEIR